MKLTVVGLGKLGSVLAAVLADAGHDVLGIDKNPGPVEAINDGLAPVDEPWLGEMIQALFPGALSAQVGHAGVENTSMSFIVVPTPSDADGRFSNDYILEAIDGIGQQLQLTDRWHTVVVCSTTMPGSMRDVIGPALEKASGRVIGETVGLCYSPEFIALGSVIANMQKPDLVLVGAEDERSAEDLCVVTATYVTGNPVYHRLTWTEAELAKISVNTYVTMKISFANMVGELSEHLGIDGHQVLLAVGDDRRIGTQYLLPAGSYGGPCFPRDNEAFGALGVEVGVPTPLASATDEINTHTARRIAAMLEGHTVAILGLSYKVGTSVTERSLARSLIAILGTDVVVHDPVARVDDLEVEQCATVEATIADASAVVVATGWPEYAAVDFGDRLVVDCWDMIPSGPRVRTIGKPSDSHVS